MSVYYFKFEGVIRIPADNKADAKRSMKYQLNTITSKQKNISIVLKDVEQL
jgi:hypothetical protein